MILSHGCEIDLADTLSLILLIRDDDLLRYERAAVRWLSRYTAEDRQLRLAEAGELVDMLDAVGKHDQVAALRLERFLRERATKPATDCARASRSRRWRVSWATNRPNTPSVSTAGGASRSALTRQLRETWADGANRAVDTPQTGSDSE
jgi:hypothetical protein